MSINKDGNVSGVISLKQECSFLQKVSGQNGGLNEQ